KTGTSSNYSDGWFMGITKDFVTGTWVGGEDRCIHFPKNMKMEGCHEALPVFGKFMTKVYKDNQLGITKGKFPAPTVKITKNYYCPTPWDKKDSTDNTGDDDVPVDSNKSKVVN
ncbi:MAG: penicillin-binding protein, partial [Bacteroidales bacterium]